MKKEKKKEMEKMNQKNLSEETSKLIKGLESLREWIIKNKKGKENGESSLQH